MENPLIKHAIKWHNLKKSRASQAANPFHQILFKVLDKDSSNSDCDCDSECHIADLNCYTCSAIYLH